MDSLTVTQRDKIASMATPIYGVILLLCAAYTIMQFLNRQWALASVGVVLMLTIGTIIYSYFSILSSKVTLDAQGVRRAGMQGTGWSLDWSQVKGVRFETLGPFKQRYLLVDPRPKQGPAPSSQTTMFLNRRLTGPDALVAPIDPSKESAVDDFVRRHTVQ